MEDTEIAYEWPDIYPEGVPPEDSTPAKGKAFRLVDEIPPSEQDFLMSIERIPDRNTISEKEAAKMYGVSLFTKSEAAIDKKNRYPSLKLKKIAFGTLIPSLGKISKPNRNHHITLWKCCDSKPHLYINKELKPK